MLFHSNWCRHLDLLNPKRVQLSFTLQWTPEMMHIEGLHIIFKNTYISFPVPPQTQNCTVTQIVRWIAKSDGIYCLIPFFCVSLALTWFKDCRYLCLVHMMALDFLHQQTQWEQFLCCLLFPIMWKCVSSSKLLLWIKVIFLLSFPLIFVYTKYPVA